MPTMFEIDKAAQDYSQAHAALAMGMTDLDEQITRLKREWMPVLRKMVEKAAAKKSALRDMIDDSRGLFEKPKTRILHGVKLGIVKGKGKLVIEDEDQTVKLIRKHLADQADLLIRCIEKPNKEALNSLDVKDLKRIGVTAEDTGDQIIVKPTDSEIDKFVDALLSEEDPEAA